MSLLSALQFHEFGEENVRECAAQAIIDGRWQVEDGETLAALVACLEHDDPEVRHAAFQAIRRCDAEQWKRCDIEQLTGMLAQEDQRAVQAACWLACVDHDLDRILPILQETIRQSRSRALRCACLEAFVELGGDPVSGLAGLLTEPEEDVAELVWEVLPWFTGSLEPLQLRIVEAVGSGELSPIILGRVRRPGEAVSDLVMQKVAAIVDDVLLHDLKWGLCGLSELVGCSTEFLQAADRILRSDSDPDNRWWAASCLGDLADHPQGVPAPYQESLASILRHAFTDPAPNVRADALDAWRNLNLPLQGNESWLLQALDDSEATVTGTVRGAAFQLLCHAGSLDRELLGRLWATLSIETIEAVGPDAQFKDGVYELVKSWGAELTPHLRPLLRHSSPTVRVGLLDTFWHCPALADSLRDEISLLIESDHPAVRSSSITALGLTSSFDSSWKSVAGRLADPDPVVRRAAARFLTRCEPRGEVAELALQLCGDTTPLEDRLTLALVLARHAPGSPQGLPVLIEAARSRVSREYDLAEQFLADLHAVQPIPELLGLVSDETVGLGALREAFSAGLRSGNLNVAEFTKAVLGWLRSTQTRERLAAAYFLGSRPDEIAVEDDRLSGLLHDCLCDDNPYLQLWAAYAIVATRSIRQTKCGRGP